MCLPRCCCRLGLSPSLSLSASIVHLLSKLPPIRPDGSAYTHDSTSPSSLSFFAGSPLQLALHRALLRMSNALAPLKGITQNLPAFIRQPLIAVIGKECYTSLVWWVPTLLLLLPPARTRLI